MSERRENSVLVALRELRGIEDDRVKREQEEARARSEAERAAKEASERQTREEEEARRLAEEDRLRRIEEEKQAKIREEQLRLEEADRRARVDGEMKLQEERMRLEMQSRSGAKSPLKAVIAVTVVLALAGAVIVYKIQAANRQENAERERKLDQERTQERLAAKAAQAELERKILAITRDMDEKLKAAKTDAERAQIRSDALLARREATSEERSGRRGKKGGTASDQPGKSPAVHVPGKRDINDNLLDGL
jgi:dTMP kinase